MTLEYPENTEAGGDASDAISAKPIWIGIAVAVAIAIPFFVVAFANLGPASSAAVELATPHENLETVRCNERFEAAGERVDALTAELKDGDQTSARTERSVRRIARQIDSQFPSQTLSTAEYARYLPYKRRLDRAVASNEAAVDDYNSTLKKLKRAQRRLDRLGKIDC